VSPGRRRRHATSAAEWLSLLDVDGPFLAAPVVKEAFPAGLPALDQDRTQRLREASAALDASIGNRDSFVQNALRDFLNWGDRLREGSDLPAGLTVAVPEHHVTVQPTFALLGPEEGSAPKLLGIVLPPGTRPTGRAGSDTWSATPADRLAHALRHHRVPLGLLTDGNEWTLVGIPDGGPASYVSWTRYGWFDEPDTLKAFHGLLWRTQFFGVDDSQTLPAMLAESLRRQEELTDRLSGQAHAAVEMLVACLGRLDVEHRARTGAALLPESVTPGDVYAASVTLLMRLLFLLYAEERDLLPLDDDTYAEHYALTTLLGQLRQDADEHGEATLERSSAAWHRLLALSRAVHRGSRHHTLNLNAYGGSLFDPDRFPWLEGRSDPHLAAADRHVPPVDDRTMLRALEALTQVRVPGEPEPRAVSFAVLDVEQIGYVYEGLLDQDAERADTWICGVIGVTRGVKDGPELPLHELESHLAQGVDAFTSWLAVQIKDSGGSLSPAAIRTRLTPLSGEERLRAEQLIGPVCSGDQSVVERLLLFVHLLRRDPRDLPVVYGPGSLYLTESSLRANTGAVYTPRFLAERVVVGALEPLVYKPGPLETEDKSAWTLITPEQLLALKVIDIAAGSGAFLVSAARYLAQRLLESRARYEPERVNTGLAQEEQLLEATRAVIDHCIYGVDINPLALEMAKLSLWLISLDKTRPFGFLDDRLAVGDSLLGVSSPDQLRELHMDPRAGRQLHRDEQALELFNVDTDRMLTEAAELRRRISEIELHDSRDADHKQRLLDEACRATELLRLVADRLSGASLAGGSDGTYLQVVSDLQVATTRAREGDDTGWRHFEQVAATQLAESHGQARRPAHFPLLFPEVFQGATGFSAVVGNPPFLGGQKLTGAFGTDYREHLVRAVGRGARGSADLVAYMVLRGNDLLEPARGQTGLIATNTLAQGDTRSVGLDQVAAEGLAIRAAVKSEKWPTAGANLEYSIVWGSRQALAPGIRAVADGILVPAITPSLDAAGRVTGNPHRLSANRGIAFQGTNIVGIGFTLPPQRAEEMINENPADAEVLFPYINGEDLNSRPDSSGSRWVINFHDWPLERARQHEKPMRQVLELVKPDRDNNNRANYRDSWWRFGEHRPGLYRAITGLERVLAIALVSKVALPVFVPSRQVFSHQLAVFATDDAAMLTLLSSAPHYWWAIKWASSMRTDLRYTPSDVFETLPFPSMTEAMRHCGNTLHQARSEFMLARNLGLTKTYNLVHSPVCTDLEVKRLRDIHREIDAAVCDAYGWDDLLLEHDHYETRQGVRYTVSPAAQVELVDRLLELNFSRHGEEVASGGSASRPRGARTTDHSAQGDLFGEASNEGEGDA
jgi:hypothetical protein